MINPQDMKDLLQEPDGKELYQMAAETKKAFAHEQETEIDVEHEWNKFAARHTTPWYVRYRAIAACAALFVGVTIAAIVHITATPTKPTQQSEDGKPAPTEQTQQVGTSEQEMFVFDNATLKTVLMNLAVHYNAEVEFRNSKSRNIRLHVQIDKGLSLQEAVELLNHFDKVNLKLTDNNTIIAE